MAAELKPFTPRTTETIERANRLLAFRDSPAFNELGRICDELVGEARDNQRRFKGWDTQQIVTLAIRVQVAEEFKEQLFVRMAEAITMGVQEAASALNNRAAVEASDKLRDQVLRKVDSAESRVPGSF
jgi:hypothetical protein